MSSLVQRLYGYHAWANNDLFDKLETVHRQQHQAERHTILRLINHYYVVSRIFAAHLSGLDHGYTSDNTVETPTLEALRVAVTSSDQWYLDYLGNAAPAQLAEVVAFTFTDGDKGYMSRQEMIAQVVLHGGYHRGEIGRILWQLSVTPPWDTFAVYLHQTEPMRRRQGDGGRPDGKSAPTG